MALHKMDPKPSDLASWQSNEGLASFARSNTFLPQEYGLLLTSAQSTLYLHHHRDAMLIKYKQCILPMSAVYLLLNVKEQWQFLTPNLRHVVRCTTVVYRPVSLDWDQQRT